MKTLGVPPPNPRASLPQPKRWVGVAKELINTFYSRKEETTMKTKNEQLKEQARKELQERGLIIEGNFEGDFETYIGCYARPINKPTALDPMNEQEVQEQEKHAVNGFPQDFTEWYEWEINNGKLENFL